MKIFSTGASVSSKSVVVLITFTYSYFVPRLHSVLIVVLNISFVVAVPILIPTTGDPHLSSSLISF